jgi:hypothetical protein
MPKFFAAMTVLLAASLASAQGRFAPPRVPPGMKGVEGKYHLLIHDLTPEEEREVLVRIEAMVDEYIARTRDFSGRLNQKLPFYLFRNEADYNRAGGIPGSAGVFMGDRLMAIAGEKLNNNTWHTIQHEGFHQFAAAVIGGDMPIWVNEGLAEYFGEAVYTGDGFVSGAIPRGRLSRVQKLIKDNQFRPIDHMMRLSHQQWNRELDVTNYDQAWSMVTFLAHGEDGKYQKAFGRFMVQLNRGRPYQQAWRDTFGSADGFEERFRGWWTAEDRDASVDVYARAATQMLTSYLARAASQKQTFTEIEPLLDAIEKGEIKSHKSDTLPTSLAKDCIELSRALLKNGATFVVGQIPSDKNPRVTNPGIKCTLEDGTVITATYKLKGSRIGSVSSEIEYPKQAAPKAASDKK